MPFLVLVWTLGFRVFSSVSVRSRLKRFSILDSRRKEVLTNVRSLKVKMKHVLKISLGNLNKWAHWSTYLFLLALLLNVPSFHGGGRLCEHQCTEHEETEVGDIILLFPWKMWKSIHFKNWHTVLPFKVCYFYSWYLSVTASDPLVLVVRQWDVSPSQHTENGRGTELIALKFSQQ